MRLALPLPAQLRYGAIVAGIAVIAVLAVVQLGRQLHDQLWARPLPRSTFTASEAARIEALLGVRAPVLGVLQRHVPADAIVLVKRRPEAARVASDLHQLAYPLQLLDESLAHLPRVGATSHLFVLDLAPQGNEEWQQLFEPVATGTQYSLWRPRSR